MLDVNDFLTDRGGDPQKIKESQRRRFASEGAVDEVLQYFENARRGNSLLLCTYLQDLISLPGSLSAVRGSAS